MDRKGHLVIGVIAFLLYQPVLDNSGAAARGPWLIGILCTLAGSILPDVLEPALTSRHRGFFHSRWMLCMVSVLFILMALAAAVSLPAGKTAPAYPASCFLLGYLTHLLADATTPAGLPR